MRRRMWRLIAERNMADALRTLTFGSSLPFCVAVASMPALYTFQANSFFFCSRATLPSRRYPCVHHVNALNVLAHWTQGSMHSYIGYLGSQLQHPISISFGAAELVHGLECRSSVVQGLDMQPAVALAECLADLACARVHCLIEDGTTLKCCLLIVFAGASFPLHLPAARASLHSLAMDG